MEILNIYFLRFDFQWYCQLLELSMMLNGLKNLFFMCVRMAIKVKVIFFNL